MTTATSEGDRQVPGAGPLTGRVALVAGATRGADAKRPSVQALLAAVRAAAADLGWPAPPSAA